MGVGLGDSMDDVAAVEHTGAAVDDQIIGREVLGKVVSPEEGEGESLPHPLPEQTGNFFAANVLGCRGMGAGFRNEDRGVLSQRCNGFGPM